MMLNRGRLVLFFSFSILVEFWMSLHAFELNRRSEQGDRELSSGAQKQNLQEIGRAHV